VSDDGPPSASRRRRSTPTDALVQLKRSLRDLKPLAERGSRFELQGPAVLELAPGRRRAVPSLARG
jgi:hypothetical protein